MVTSLLLLALLFIAGFVNVYFYFPRKKFHAWLQFFFPNPPPKVAAAADATHQVVSVKGNGESTKSNEVELKRVFATFDKNGDGFITKQELRESLKNIRLSMTEKEVEDMVVKVDANGDGLIDFQEFCILCQHMDGGGGCSKDRINGVSIEEEEEDELREAFDVFDKDKDGLISFEELGSVLRSLGLKEGTKLEDCKAMIRKVDMDGDGMVNFDEFKVMMKSGGGLISVSAL